MKKSAMFGLGMCLLWSCVFYNTLGPAGIPIGMLFGLSFGMMFRPNDKK